MVEQQGSEKWRHRARETRVYAVKIQDEECRRIIFGIATGYDQMAEAAAQIEECSALLGAEHIKHPFELWCQRGEPRQS